MATDTTVQDRLAGTWNFNPVHSSASFAVKYLVAPFRGRFETVEATLADGRLTGKVDARTIVVRDENLAAHLQSPEFFDTEAHPYVEFASRELTIDGDAVTLTGDLTIKGITQPVTATGTIAGPSQHFAGHTALGFELEATIDRTAFGLNWNAPLPKGGGPALSNEVKLIVELEFVQS
ncbi:MAG TPA: YceI family protein [Capillimicrobium sp.]|nr:YceI family protein [Capillimicrobium sp.]